VEIFRKLCYYKVKCIAKGEMQVELNWLQSLFYGFLSGLTEFFPVSADAHRRLYLALFGLSESESGLLFSARLGCLLAVIFATLPLLNRLDRERRFSAMSRRRTKRQPDTRTMASLHLIKVAIFPVLLGLLAFRLYEPVMDRLWLLALLLTVNGIMLYIPQFLPSGNKDSLNLTTMDALLVGIAGAAGVIPGLSRIGMMTSVSGMRGTDRRYGLDIGLLLCIPVLLVLTVLDAGAWIISGGLTFLSLLRYLCTAAASFGGAYLSIITMRFISFKSGYSGFAYYSWGLALSTFILYLSI